MAEQDWSSFHIVLHDFSASERFLLDFIQSDLPRLADSGLTGWFFIRYWEGGPHIRVRLKGLGQAEAGALEERLCATVPSYRADTGLTRQAYYGAQKFDGQPVDVDALAWWEDGTVVARAYEPELSRYGGVEAMAASERLFCASSAIAVKVIAATRDGWASRLKLALILMAAGASAAYPDNAAAGRYFQSYGDLWSGHLELADTLGATPGPSEVDTGVAALARGRAHGQPGKTSIAELWRGEVSAVLGDLEGLAVGGLLLSPLTGRRVTGLDEARAAIGSILASQIHMLNNRLGVPPTQEHRFARVLELAALQHA